MALVKICPNCGKLHNAAESFCMEPPCEFTDLSEVQAVSEEEARMRTTENANETISSTDAGREDTLEATKPVAEPDSQNTVVASPPRLTLRHGKRDILARSGDVLGRHNTGKEIFDEIREISRHHLRISREGSVWRVEDQGSTNGTTLNRKMLEREQSCVVKAGDVICLAGVCELKVIAP
jgi:hypothetical protein